MTDIHRKRKHDDDGASNARKQAKLTSEDATSACKRVFAVQELADIMLEELFDSILTKPTMWDALFDVGQDSIMEQWHNLSKTSVGLALIQMGRCKQVCKRMEHAIANSKPLHQLMSMSPAPVKLNSESPLGTLGDWRVGHLADTLFDCSYDGYHQLASGDLQFEMYIDRDMTGHYLATNCRSNPLATTYLTQPPVTTLDVVVPHEHADPEPDDRTLGFDEDGQTCRPGARISTLYREGGITIADVIEAAGTKFRYRDGLDALLLKSADHVKAKRLAMMEFETTY